MKELSNLVNLPKVDPVMEWGIRDYYFYCFEFNNYVCYFEFSKFIIFNSTIKLWILTLFSDFNIFLKIKNHRSFEKAHMDEKSNSYEKEK